MVDKRHPILVAMKEKVDQQYAKGRNTVMSDLELEVILKELDYEFYTRLIHGNDAKHFIG